MILTINEMQRLAQNYLNALHNKTYNSGMHLSGQHLTQLQLEILQLWDTHLSKPLNINDSNKKSLAHLLYPLAAYTDEKAFELPGDNSLSWSEHSLQQKYFKTMQAGENFFIHLEEILQSENKENAIVYLLCLQHGFHGKYKTAAIEAKQQNETLLTNDQQSTQQAHAINPLEVIITNAKQQLSSSINPEKTSSIKKPPAAIRYIICVTCAIYIVANLAHSNIEAKRNLKKITTLTAVKPTAQRINHA